jgi:hypothetical protein
MVKPFEQEDAVRIRGARIRTASALAVQGEEQGTTASAKGIGPQDDPCPVSIVLPHNRLLDV